MDEKMRKYINTCPNCKEQMQPFFKDAFKGGYLNKKLNVFKQRYFCSKKCYEDYKKDFVVEIYNEQPIYCVEIDREKRYMPYFEANYYFINIDDCKKRMDMKSVAVVDMSMYGFLMNA